MGTKFIGRGIITLIPIIIILIFIAMLSGLVAGHKDVPAEVTNIVDELSASPVSGTTTRSFGEYGQSELSWGLGQGAMVFILATIIFIIAGIFEILARCNYYETPEEGEKKEAKGELEEAGEDAQEEEASEEVVGEEEEWEEKEEEEPEEEEEWEEEKEEEPEEEEEWEEEKEEEPEEELEEDKEEELEEGEGEEEPEEDEEEELEEGEGEEEPEEDEEEKQESDEDEEDELEKEKEKPEDKEAEGLELEGGKSPDSGQVQYTPSQLKRMKKKDLINIIESMDLDTTGTKADLIDRIIEKIKENK